MTDLDKHLQEIASEIWLECMNFKNDPGYPRTSAEFNAWLHDKIKEINSIPKEINVDLSEILDELINQVEWSVRVPGAVEIDRVKESKAKTEAIAAIHHAFKDAGWMPWDGSPMKIEPSAKYEANMMTGAEWYQRFDEAWSNIYLEKHDALSASEWIEAAKIASGINNDKAKQ